MSPFLMCTIIAIATNIVRGSAIAITRDFVFCVTVFSTTIVVGSTLYIVCTVVSVLSTSKNTVVVYCS